ncbi:hypothetical protein J7T55_003216 [Diaporthe amygdali]|uniref:uncharacterized protein n=1 Tax=Phomopsis amygdali TaxID=1214568 RepID=UPI0022FDCFCC|nr:uncharacterized protein J7T55_003216 [Diaporthe amygdali]KAJ0122700.1 hypothetical protein J7T55_003216 [Diaporthe amygdali]
MASVCPMQNGGGFRGPPIPLVVVPVIYHLMRSNPDMKLTKYVKDLLNKGGPMSVAENAHYIAQYILSKVPSNVLYWLGTKVLQLQPEVAMQTTEFLKSRTQLELPPQPSDVGNDVARLASADAITIPSDIERRLEKLEMDYQMLQEKHTESLKLLTYKADGTVEIPRELSLPTPPESPEIRAHSSTEPGQLEITTGLPWSSRSAASDIETQALLQEIGLRLGKVVLEWAGDMMKQSLMSTASAKSPSESKFGAAGLDLTGRLANSLTT